MAYVNRGNRLVGATFRNIGSNAGAQHPQTSMTVYLDDSVPR